MGKESIEYIVRDTDGGLVEVARIEDSKFKWHLIPPPTPNLELQWGEDNLSVRYCFNCKKTIRNRIGWWLFCKVFPFKIVRWDKCLS